MNLSPQDRLSAARIRMLERMPFYGLIAMRLTLQADTATPDVWVDGKTLGFNPDWASSASFDTIISAIAHSAHHLALLHHLRRCGRDDAQWQVACDVPVNAALESGGFVLPESVWVRTGDELKSAEECYAAMPKRENPEGEEGGSPGKGEVRDQPGKNGGAMDASELAEAASDAMKDIAAAAQQAKASGFGLPADIARQLQALLYPQEDWRELLREYMHSVAKSDYSWSRPNRRFIGSGLYLPSLQSESEMGTMVIAVDTSGSIDERKLSLFGGAMNELLEELNPERVVVLYCDTTINRVNEYARDDYPIEIHAAGYGCTDLRPPFDYVSEHGLEPDVFLYFTDLGGPKPEQEPCYPVLWIDQDDREDRMNRYGAPWGRHIGMRC